MVPYAVTVDGVNIAGTYFEPVSHVKEMPLLVALHGGTYDSNYFSVAGGPLGSFVDIALRNGFAVLALDRPGYGKSGSLPDKTSSFARQAGLLDVAIAQCAAQRDAASVVLIGHSIGAMICLEIAARRPTWPLVGASTTGMGARHLTERLAPLPVQGMVDLPHADREAVMFGESNTFTMASREAARTSYAPAPVDELAEARVWARDRLGIVASNVIIPVQNILAEHDPRWDSSPEALAEFRAYFSSGVSTALARRVGHSIDHHLLGAALHLQQLAFAYTCALSRRRPLSGAPQD